MKINKRKWVFSRTEFLEILEEEFLKSDFDPDYFFSSMRWGDGMILCPFCESEKDIGGLNVKKRGKNYFVLKCYKCRKQFTLKVGTIFDRCKFKISELVKAIYLMQIKKYSAHKMSKELNITYKSSWFLAHRIDWFLMNELL